MRRSGLLQLALLLLAMGIAGCGPPLDESDSVANGVFPCWPYDGHGYSSRDFPEHFLLWTPDGANPIFNHAKTIYAVDVEVFNCGQ